MKVAVVMAVYNGGTYLQEAIQGILAQTYEPLEIIIVNDGSTDTTQKILDGINDERVEIIHLDVKQGAANALNMAIQKSESEWIAIHDADDISMPERIQEQVEYVTSHPDIVAVGSFIECIKGHNISDSRSGRLQKLARTKNSITTREQIKLGLFHGCPLTHGSLMFSKQAFLKAGSYNLHYKIAYDYDLYLRLMTIGPIENIPKVLYKYRISTNSLSNIDVKETSDEFLVACSQYIRQNCFGELETKPRVFVYGTVEGCQRFSDLMLTTNGLNVQGHLSRFNAKKLEHAYQDFIHGKIQAFVILNNSPDAGKMKRFLEQKRLILNEDFFTLWCAV